MTVCYRITMSVVVGAALTAIGLALELTGGWGPSGPVCELVTIGRCLCAEHIVFLFTTFPGLEAAAAQAGVPDWVWFALPWLDWALAVLLVSMMYSLVTPCKHRRHRPGSCAACGYDLTGNVSGRCPECGTAPVHSAGPECRSVPGSRAKE